MSLEQLVSVLKDKPKLKFVMIGGHPVPVTKKAPKGGKDDEGKSSSASSEGKVSTRVTVEDDPNLLDKKNLGDANERGKLLNRRRKRLAAQLASRAAKFSVTAKESGSLTSVANAQE